MQCNFSSPYWVPDCSKSPTYKECVWFLLNTRLKVNNKRKISLYYP